ncbi:hypothetical protein GE061_016316 [Apolygus lucorum]|uniref:mTERF domain-containing protein 2 n=1 Tax=Apolygus lucorum TaxID=248454 RepID=A0A6A4JS50_APOLU|nr:hypothetical protein GE061_016316 [Apolygus lucorum]
MGLFASFTTKEDHTAEFSTAICYPSSEVINNLQHVAFEKYGPNAESIFVIFNKPSRCTCKAPVRLLTSSAAPPIDQHQDSAPIVQWLRENGFPEDACIQISAKLPSSIWNPSKLNRTMSHWGACQFGHDRLVYLLTENPDLLLMDHQQVMNCFTFLSKDFSKNYVYKILLNCPQVMFEKHSDITSKLDFLNKKLGVPNSEIVNSSSLGHPLEYMRTRYEFLKRCGVYKVVPQGGVSRNPSLSNMFDTPDEEFAKQVARLSPLEFDVFKQLYALEIEDEDDDLSDSDSD